MDGAAFVTAAAASEILGCTVGDLDKWRRTVLPGDKRRAAGQDDGQYRRDEVVAVSVGLWLRQLGSKEAERFAAKLVLDPPDGEHWAVLSKGRLKKPELVLGAPGIDLRGVASPKDRMFSPESVFAAMR